MKKFLLLCTLAITGYEGWIFHEKGAVKSIVPQVGDQSVTSTTPVPDPELPVSPIDVIGSSWKEKEVGDWGGAWIRRGFTNVFDAKIHSGEAGMTKTFVAVVSRNGNTIHVESSGASDGRNCTYDGELSEDGKTISGTYTWRANCDPFTVQIVPVARTAHEHAAAGTYYLLNYRSVRTAHGLTGLAPGTQVQQVSDKGDTVAVVCQGFQLDVPKGELTNDLAIVRDLVSADASEQAWASAKASADFSHAEAAKIAQMQREENSRNKQVAAAQRKAPARQWSNPLDRPAYGQTSIRDHAGSYRSGSVNSSVAATDARISEENTQQQLSDLKNTQIRSLQNQIDVYKKTQTDLPFDRNRAEMERELTELRTAN